MKYFILTLAFLLTVNAHAEITIVEVANGKAVIQFDKTDELTMDSKLVLKNLSLGSSASTPTAELNCPACPTLTSEIKTDYKRTHLISGEIKSYKQDQTIKSATSSADVEYTKVELQGSYLYNLKQFGLGFSYSNTKENTDGDEEVSASFGLVGRFFFIENIAKNNFVPFVGLELATLTSEDSSSPKIELELSGSSIDIGFLFFAAPSAFIEFTYSIASVDGDVKQGSTTLDYEATLNGLGIGIGIALE